MSGLIALSETIAAINKWRRRQGRWRGNPDRRKLYLMYRAKLEAIKNQESLEQLSQDIISDMGVSCE